MSVFQGKNVLVTGGSSGLGLGLARGIAKSGGRVTIVARDPDKLAAARADIEAAVPGASVETLSVDICDSAALTEAVGSIKDLDVLVNNAGILHEGYFETLPDSVFRDTMETNFFATVNATRAALPQLLARKGILVNISSCSGLIGVFGYSSYCSAKYALNGFTETLRYELADRDISLHLICPPEFDSPMVDTLDQTRTAENRAHTLMSPKQSMDTMVKDILHGVERGRFMIVPGKHARLSMVAARLFPGATRKMGDLTISKARRKK